MKNLFLFTLLFATYPLLHAHANQTDCSDAKGLFHYLNFKYAGGMAPRPGTLISKIEWSSQGTVLFHEERVAGAHEEPAATSTFTAQFLNETKTMIQEETSQHGEVGSQDYTIQAVLNFDRTIDGKVITVLLICHYDYLFAP